VKFVVEESFHRCSTTVPLLVEVRFGEVGTRECDREGVWRERLWRSSSPGGELSLACEDEVQARNLVYTEASVSVGISTAPTRNKIDRERDIKKRKAVYGQWRSGNGNGDNSDGIVNWNVQSSAQESKAMAGSSTSPVQR